MTVREEAQLRLDEASSILLPEYRELILGDLGVERFKDYQRVIQDPSATEKNLFDVIYALREWTKMLTKLPPHLRRAPAQLLNLEYFPATEAHSPGNALGL